MIKFLWDNTVNNLKKFNIKTNFYGNKIKNFYKSQKM